MNRKIGVTGGSGFIGQYLISDYGDRFDFVVATSRNRTEGLCPKAEYVKTDYNIEGFKQVFRGCEAIVHFGGKVMHGMDSGINLNPYLENLTLADNLFQACRELNIANIVNASSVAVYDQISEIPVREEDPLQPNSAYGIAKITVEKLAELYNRKYGFKIKSLRYAQGIGYGKNMDSSRFWTICLNNSVKGLPIPVYGRGITGRDIIYVRDMARAAICAMEKGNISGVFNIGTEVITSNRDIAEMYCSVFENTSGGLFIIQRNLRVELELVCHVKKQKKN